MVIPYSLSYKDYEWVTHLRWLFDREDYTTIIAITDLLLQQHDLSDLWIVRGKSFYELKNYDAALYCFNQVKESGDDLTNCYKGLSLQALNRYKEAIVEYEKVKEKGVKEYNLACCYCLLGELSTALRYVKLAIKAKKSNKEDLANDPDLSALEDHPQFIKLVKPA